jgi:hypothetical protein
MKLDLGKILSIASLVSGLVKNAQSAFKGAKGIEKHVVVAEAVKDLVPIVEGAAGKDLVDNDRFLAAIDRLIVAEKAAFKAVEEAKAARQAVEEVIADIKRLNADPA